MPLSISNLRERTATIDVYKLLGVKDLAGQLNVEYKLLAEKTLQDDADEASLELSPQEKARNTAESILRRVIKWDLLDKPLEEGGTMIPLEMDAILEQVPMQVLIDIGDAITENTRLSKKR